MTTFGTMVSRISRELRRDGLTADIKDAIVSSINAERDERYWFNEASASATISSGATTFTAPTGLIEIDDIYLQDSGGQTYSIRHTPDSEFFILDEQTNGFPTDFAYYGETFHIWPPSDRNLSAHIHYLKDINTDTGAITASASNGVTNAWMVEGEELIRLESKYRVFLHRLRNDRDAAGQKLAASDVRRRLKSRTTKQTGTGRIHKTQF